MLTKLKVKIELLSKAPLRPGDGLAEPGFYLAFHMIISFKNFFDDHNFRLRQKKSSHSYRDRSRDIRRDLSGVVK